MISGSGAPVRRGRKILALTLTVLIAEFASTRYADAQLFGTPAPTASPFTTIIGRMGILMSESDARHGIAFRPFAPPRRILAVALLPPFHGDDARANRGIGYEYTGSGARRYALAEWPLNGGTIEHFAPLAQADPECASARTFGGGRSPNGIVWATPNGIIITLQADGTNDAETLQAEWKKLVRRGICR